MKKITKWIVLLSVVVMFQQIAKSENWSPPVIQYIKSFNQDLLVWVPPIQLQTSNPPKYFFAQKKQLGVKNAQWTTYFKINYPNGGWMLVSYPTDENYAFRVGCGNNP